MTLLRVLTVVFVLICLAITVVILLQEGKQAGLTGAISGAADSYWGKVWQTATGARIKDVLWKESLKRQQRFS